MLYTSALLLSTLGFAQDIEIKCGESLVEFEKKLDKAKIDYTIDFVGEDGDLAVEWSDTFLVFTPDEKFFGGIMNGKNIECDENN